LKNRVAVVGGGLIGLATAYQLLLRHPDLSLDLFEKEAVPGKHQSGRNSGVLHCGLYYQPGSLKAKLAVEGIQEMTNFCRIHEIDHEICGKIVIASTDEQLATLEELANRGKKNGLTGLTFLNSQQIKKREPYVAAKKALLVPQEGIVSYKAVMLKLVELIEGRGGRMHFNATIKMVEQEADGCIHLQSGSDSFIFNRLINCTGLHSDRTFEQFTNQKRPLRIVPFRGEYLMLKPEMAALVNHLIYPVPDINFPFLGVHFTRLVSGEREVGPNAVLAFKREGYTNYDFSLRDTLDSTTYIGLLQFMRKNLRFALGEFSSSLFVSSFIAKAKKLIPDIDESMLVKGTAGVRAQAMDPQGNLIMDFRIVRKKNQIHVLNAPSPGATCSLAIANYILDNYLTDIN